MFPHVHCTWIHGVVCVWPLLLSSSPWVCFKLKWEWPEPGLLVQCAAVHKWVQPGRPAPSRCAKGSGKKCFTHFGCVTCCFHTFQLCYLLTRIFSVVSLDCSNWITVEPELAQTGVRKSLPWLAVIEALGVWPCIRWGACFEMWDLCSVHLHYVIRSLPCALDTVSDPNCCVSGAPYPVLFSHCLRSRVFDFLFLFV